METSTPNAHLPSIFGLFFFGNQKGGIKLLTFWAIYKVIFDILLFVAVQNDINTSALMHFYIPIELGFLALIFAEATKTYITPKVYHFTLTIFVIFSGVNLVFFSNLNPDNLYGRTLESVLVIGFVMAYLSQLMSQLKVERLEKDPFFLMSCTLLLYFTSVFFKSFVIIFFQEPKAFLVLFEQFLTGLNFLCNLVLLIAVWLASKQKN